MRFQNWDVLLFPEGSKIPIQEFKVQCFVTNDDELPALQIPSTNHALRYLSDRRLPVQLPVMTTFVPSLLHNSPFRISIHTWEKPKPSRVTENLMLPEDSAAFEARVYVDGIFVSGSIFDARSNWPSVIETSSQLDKEGNQDALRFPPFHQEILQQSHWDAAETLGRVRVVVAEGFARLRRSPPFERVRDIVAFSFQHAPLHVLEYSAIAWPNPGMWQQAQSRPTYNAPPPAARYNPNVDEDAHAHSPNKAPRTRGDSMDNSIPLEQAWANRAMPPPALPWDASLNANIETMPDPFIDLDAQPRRSRQPRWNQKSSVEDITMPDYSQTDSKSSRATSGMTGISYEQKAQSIAPDVDDAAIAELVEALSPLRGTHAPTNTPSGEQVVSTITKPSAAAEARSASYTNSIKSKKEGKNKENESTLSSRPPSQPKIAVIKAIDTDGPLPEGKRKRSAAGTPEGRRVSETRSVSPVGSASMAKNPSTIAAKNSESITVGRKVSVVIHGNQG